MSSDEEDSGVITDGKDINNVTPNVDCLPCDKCVTNSEINVRGSVIGENASEEVTESNSNRTNGDISSTEKQTTVRKKHHVRGTSGKWTVSDLSPILASVQPTMVKATNNGEQLVKNEVNREQLTEGVGEKHGIGEKAAAPKTNIAEVKKAVNIPVIRDKDIQVGIMENNL